MSEVPPTKEECSQAIRVLQYIQQRECSSEEERKHLPKLKRSYYTKVKSLAKSLSEPYFLKKEEKRREKIQAKHTLRLSTGLELSARQKAIKYHRLYKTEDSLCDTEKEQTQTEDISCKTLKIRCYICKKRFQPVIGHFYDQLCEPCSVFSLEKRNQTRDLSDHVAVVTGCRVKIGFEVCLKLLRANCYVIGTTRFPQDALKRYQMEADFKSWESRLCIYGLDFRYLRDLEKFCGHIQERYKKIDILINNAAQTIDRPTTFYKDQIEGESEKKSIQNNVIHYLIQQEQKKEIVQYDYDHQPLLSQTKKTSWQLQLNEVSTKEILETHCINYFAPFLLIRDFTSLMTKCEPYFSYIINVSAMEGQFNRVNKTSDHPHTNAAKAALNMLTRTSGPDYKHKHRIIMASCDTGWISNYNNFATSSAELWKNPIDSVDGAARILDLIFTHSDLSGYFWKDYKICTW